jgi:serine/threonine-protein kinase
VSDLLVRLQAALESKYAVESEIGRGGMAVVYLAEDRKHRRQVAIKVLQPDLTATLGAERFLHEIETVASLNHPHILPLHDSGEADGLLYYVMPLARGESLRQLLDREKQLAVDESVRIAVEVADGLDYAHRQGVVHRDIKPGNILLSECHAVIADFGIARAIEAARQERITSTGLGVGTPLYASPEQATAQETLDGRTDIYSLACVLYEMLAGEPPLTGSTPQMIQARRMSETPTALHTLRETVPAALDPVIARALGRIPADRYATASQFGQALQAVLLSTTPAADANRAVTPESLATTPAVSVRESKKKTTRRWLVTASALTLGLLVVVAMLWPPSSWLGGNSLQIWTANITRITNAAGIEFQPALSPDGSEVAYITGRNEGRRVVVRSTIDVGSGGGSRPSEEIGGVHLFPSWTADGASVRFLALGFDEAGWKQVGMLSGSIRSLGVPRREDRYAWSPDGSRVAFAAGLDSIFAFDARGGDIELLGVHSVNVHQPHSLTWSPDGRWIAYVNQNKWWRTDYNVHDSSIWILSSEGGEPIQVTDEASMNQSPQWFPDSRNLLFVSNRDGPRGMYVVEVGPDGPKGRPRSVAGAADAHTISLSADGRRLAYSKYHAPVQNIWSVAITEGGTAILGDAVPVTTDNQVIDLHSVSPDGEWIAFDSDIRGGDDIYKQRLDGGDPYPIADMNGTLYSPVWSPDGAEIAFSRFLAGSTYILTVPEAGGIPTQVTTFGTDENATWSPNGLTIAFDSRGVERTGPNRLWTVSRDGADLPWGDPVQLTDFDCAYADWAPDGSGLVCDVHREGVVVLISPKGEVLQRYDPSEHGLRDFSQPEFSPDGSRIYMFGREMDGSPGIWWIPSGGRKPTKAVALDDSSRTVEEYLTVGPERLYFTVGEYESDIWVMDLEW